MFDIYIGSLNVGEILLFAIPALAFLIQLLLCFKVRSLTIRLAPTAVFALLFADFLAMMFVNGGSGGITYLILSLWDLIPLAACGVGWAVWGISRLIKQFKSK